MLNIPDRFEEELKKHLPEGKKVMLMGVGGGFDILSCLPLYYTLRMKGYELELANYSLVDFNLFPALSAPLIMNNDVYGAIGNVNGAIEHYPEGHLSKWFKEAFNEDVPVWMFRQQAVPQLIKNLQAFIDAKEIGTIILCGAGSRSIMTGEEEGCGDMLYASVVLSAIRQVETKSFLFTIGVNTSGMRRSESLYNAMENIQALILNGAHYGGCVLEKHMDCFLYYKSAYEFVVDRPSHQKSAIHEMILTAAFGGFGPHKDNGGFVCPSLYYGHIFDAITVSDDNILIPHIETIPDYDDMVQIGMGIIHNGNKRPRQVIEA